MTSEPPPTPPRRARPGASSRRKALGLDGPPAGPIPVTPGRESLTDSLSRIPDLAPGEDAQQIRAELARSSSFNTAERELLVEVMRNPGPAPAPPASTPAAPPPPTPSAPAAPASTPAAVIAAPTAATVGAAASAPAAGFSTVPPSLAGPATAPAPRAARGPIPTWRRILFGVVLVGLVAAIPALGYEGYRIISNSTAGQYNRTTLRPTDPGYEAQVDSTPTAVAIQFDEQGAPTAATFLALGGGEAGGGLVVFVPLDTEVAEPAYGVNSLRRAYDVVAERPTEARERLASQVGRLLNVGVDEVIDLGTAGWSQLVAPVAPLQIANPDPVEVGGVEIPAGDVSLSAEQVAGYLAAGGDGESDLNRLNRHQVVWSAWLGQVAKSGKADAVPGESEAGIGRFARELAKGPVTYTTLPVDTIDDGAGARFRVDREAVNALVTDTVPSPLAAVPGSRFNVRLLNGVSADAIPADLVRQIVGLGGSVTILGNGPQFGTEQTTIVYADPARKVLAEVLLKALGGTGKARLDREAPDTIDLTIVLGRDILGDATGQGSAGSTLPPSSTDAGTTGSAPTATVQEN
jgi:hypothetical protein